jgi:hypothetical protein
MTRFAVALFALVGIAASTAGARSVLYGSSAVCARSVSPAIAHCDALVLTDARGVPASALSPSTLPSGYGPTQFQTAYGVVSQAAAATTAVVAIVVAFDNPNVKSDLDTYDSTYGLSAFPTCSAPPAANTGCFRKVNQNGNASPLPPATNVGWATEAALQVDAVHAICPLCGILLVEANSNSLTNLFIALDWATAHANAVANSYGTSEFSDEASNDSHLNKTGIAITFASGDLGYGVDYPAASQYVTAVGGTTLTLTGSNTRASETVWNNSAGSDGSGCSAYEPKPSWQTDSGCANRTVADVSADADPNTGAAVYDTYGEPGWLLLGGTGLAASLIAGIYALAGVGPAPISAPTSTYAASYPYARSGSLFDVTSGHNGSCGSSYLCTAGVGYDGPTGLGTPNGVLAFGAAPTAADLVSLSARRAGRTVVVRWRLAQELGAIGFNVYRDKVRLNARLIRSAGAFGRDRVWRDRTLEANPSYLVELVRFDGSRRLFGPFRLG